MLNEWCAKFLHNKKDTNTLITPSKTIQFLKHVSVFAVRIMTMAASERSGTIGQITKKDAEGRFS